MYEIHGKGVRRFLIVPFAGTLAVITIVSVVLFAVGGWFLLVGPVWLAWIEWRASRLGMRADASGITVVNLLRRYEIGWEDVRGVWAYEENSPAAVNVERSRGRFWGVSVQATFGLGKVRRREIALRIAELGREYGYGFPTGDGSDLDALRRAGLFDESDPAAHQAGWDAHEPRVPTIE
jgi:hypothetical protein